MRKEIQELKDKYLGRKVYVEIEDLYSPTYNSGYVESVDDAGQLHGTWGGLAAIPGVDYIKIIEED